MDSIIDAERHTPLEIQEKLKSILYKCLYSYNPVDVRVSFDSAFKELSEWRYQQPYDNDSGVAITVTKSSIDSLDIMESRFRMIEWLIGYVATTKPEIIAENVIRDIKKRFALSEENADMQGIKERTYTNIRFWQDWINNEYLLELRKLNLLYHIGLIKRRNTPFSLCFLDWKESNFDVYNLKQMLSVMNSEDKYSFLKESEEILSTFNNEKRFPATDSEKNGYNLTKLFLGELNKQIATTITVPNVQPTVSQPQYDFGYYDTDGTFIWTASLSALRYAMQNIIFPTEITSIAGNCRYVIKKITVKAIRDTTHNKAESLRITDYENSSKPDYTELATTVLQSILNPLNSNM